MSINYQAIERDGMTKIIALAKALCRIVNAVKHIINGKFPDSEPIMLLIAAIEALCPLIAEAEADAISYGGNNDVPSETPELTPGIDPSRPPAAAPDIS
jgi:hypothetical protein